MNRFNSVLTGPIRSLEPGDLFALRAVSDSIVSGKVTAIVHYRYQLTSEQLQYMRDHGLTIPEGEYEAVAGIGSCLVFGELTNHPNHIYLDYDVNVAVFPFEKSERF